MASQLVPLDIASLRSERKTTSWQTRIDLVVSRLRHARVQLESRLALLQHNTWTIGNEEREVVDVGIEEKLFSQLLLRNSDIAAGSRNILTRLAGVSLFIPGNPNPVQPGNKAPLLIGIRFEQFVNCTYRAPYYVIFKDELQERNGEFIKVLRLYKHTVPVWIPLQKMVDQYMDNDPKVGKLMDANIGIH